MYRVFSKFALAALSLTIVACSNDAPVSPTASGAVSGTAAAADGSTLKVSAPTPTAPINGVLLNSLRPTLQINGVASQYAGTGLAYQYNFELQSGSGTLLNAITVDSTSWAYPNNLANDTPYQWRVRAIRNGAAGPWSGLQNFRTAQTLPGCINGVLADPKAYFFWLINRQEGQSARDWESVLRASGLPAGPVSGERIAPNAPFYGLSQQISSSGGLRGRVFIPTSSGDSFNYFIQQIDVLSDPGGTTWVWRSLGGPAYTPRACP